MAPSVVVPLRITSPVKESKRKRTVPVIGTVMRSANGFGATSKGDGGSPAAVCSAMAAGHTLKVGVGVFLFSRVLSQS